MMSLQSSTYNKCWLIWKHFLNDYTPTQDAMNINRERIALRLNEMAAKVAARKEKKHGKE
jgi:hypothetical protein